MVPRIHWLVCRSCLAQVRLIPLSEQAPLRCRRLRFGVGAPYYLLFRSVGWCWRSTGGFTTGGGTKKTKLRSPCVCQQCGAGRFPVAICYGPPNLLSRLIVCALCALSLSAFVCPQLTAASGTLEFPLALPCWVASLLPRFVLYFFHTWENMLHSLLTSFRSFPPSKEGRDNVLDACHLWSVEDAPRSVVRTMQLQNPWYFSPIHQISSMQLWKMHLLVHYDDSNIHIQALEGRGALLLLIN